MLTNPPFIEVPFMFYSWEMVLVVFEERMQGGGWTMVNNVVLVKFWLNTRSRETKNLDPYFITIMGPMTPDTPALTTVIRNVLHPQVHLSLFQAGEVQKESTYR